MRTVRDSGTVPPFTSQEAIQKYWSLNFAGAPDDLTDLPNANVYNSLEGWAIRIRDSAHYPRFKGYWTPLAGQVVRLTVKAKRIGSTVANIQLIARGVDSAFAGVGSNTTVTRALSSAGVVYTVSADFNMDEWLAAGAAAVMFRMSTTASGDVYISGAAIEDVTSEVAAQAQAAIAVTQAADASASASSAKLSANLAASIGGGSMNRNPQFLDWEGTFPTGWILDASANGETTKGDGINGSSWSLRQASTSQANYGVYNNTSGGTPGGEYLVYEADFTLVSGSLVGSGARVYTRRDGGQTVKTWNHSFANDYGAGEVGKTYRFRKMVDARHVDGTNYRVYGVTRWTTFGSSGAVTLDWHRIAIRPATQEEIAAGTVLPDVQAQLAITAAVAADSQTRLSSVAFGVTGGAGGDPFDVSLKAGPDGSDASITATKVRLRNVVNNQVIDALIVEGGKARFGSNVEIAGNLVVAGSIDTAQLKNGAVSKGASAASTASTSVGLNTWTDLLSAAMTTAGGEVSIDFGAQVSVVNSQGPNAVVEVRFMRGSTVLETMQIMDVLGAQTIYVQGSMDPFQTYVQINSVVSTYVHPFTVDTGAPAGSHTWKVQMRSQAGATVGAKKMRLQELKR